MGSKKNAYGASQTSIFVLYNSNIRFFFSPAAPLRQAFRYCIIIVLAKFSPAAPTAGFFHLQRSKYDTKGKLRRRRENFAIFRVPNRDL